MTPNRHPIDTVIVDLDGTLVDSVPVHVLAWQAAFRDVGIVVPSHRLQRAIGMGGDHLVAHVANDAVETALGDELRQRHPHHLERLFGAITPTEGAGELLEALSRHRINVVLATSGERDLAERFLELIPGARAIIAHVVSGSDANESKPDGELMEMALARVDGRHAVAIGDAVWDVLAASDAGIACIGLLTGGLGEAELTTAGAAAVHETPMALARHLDQTGALLTPRVDTREPSAT